MEKEWRKNTNKIQQYRCLLSIWKFNIDYYIDMFRAPICPSSGEKRPLVTEYGVYLLVVLDVAGYGTELLGCRVRVL